MSEINRDGKTPIKKRRWSARRKVVLGALAAVGAVLAVAGGWAWMLFSGFGSYGPDDPKEDRKWAAYVSLSDDVGRDDVRAVTRDLGRGVDPNKFPRDGYARQQEMDAAALTQAAGTRGLPMVRLLLDHGADPNVCDGWDGTPLTAAAARDRVDVMALLVARGARVREDGHGDSEALWQAATGGQVSAVRFLLAHGADPGMSRGGRAPETLLAATREGHQDAAARLLRRAGAKE